MLKALPRFSEQFGLSPAEFWALRWDEFTTYQEYAAESDRAHSEVMSANG